MRKALVPISLDSRAFRTATVLPALIPLVRDYDEIVFLIADRLQVYNRARRLTAGGVGEVLTKFDELSKHYYDQRVAWLHRLRHTIESTGHARKRWTILGVRDVTDGDFYSIFRNVFLAAQVLEPFAKDIRAVLGTRVGADPTNANSRLCEAYVIEEIAINIRLRIHESIESEFYFGGTLLPLLGLYEGVYGIAVSALTERRPLLSEFAFFQPEIGGGAAKWVQCHYKSESATRR